MQARRLSGRPASRKPAHLKRPVPLNPQTTRTRKARMRSRAAEEKASKREASGGGAARGAGIASSRRTWLRTIRRRCRLSRWPKPHVQRRPSADGVCSTGRSVGATGRSHPEGGHPWRGVPRDPERAHTGMRRLSGRTGVDALVPTVAASRVLRAEKLTCVSKAGAVARCYKTQRAESARAVPRR
jgi:hypothetical protein